MCMHILLHTLYVARRFVDITRSTQAFCSLRLQMKRRIILNFRYRDSPFQLVSHVALVRDTIIIIVTLHTLE